MRCRVRKNFLCVRRARGKPSILERTGRFGAEPAVTAGRCRQMIDIVIPYYTGAAIVCLGMLTSILLIVTGAVTGQGNCAP